MVRKQQRVEGPTLALIAVCYIGWAAAVFFAPGLSLWLAVPGLAVFIALHSSLQHEVLHGHPLPSRWASEALVFPALGLSIPYQRFRDTHLAHHRNEALTDPYDDPESNYLDPRIWHRLPAWARVLLRANNTLAGRVSLGPAIGLVAFYRSEARLISVGDRRVLRAWGLHLLGALPVVTAVALSSMPLWAYAIGAYLGLSVLKVRTFLEHRADIRVPGRSVIVEDRGPLSVLFLNNNLHAVHHAHPQVAWYALPALYRSRRDAFLRRNGGYTYRSYAEVARRHLVTAKDPVAHPLMDE